MRSARDHAIIHGAMLAVLLVFAAVSPELLGDEGTSTPPRPVKRVRPVLPENAETAPEGGQAVIRCTIDSSGRVKDPEVQSASGEDYGQSALEAVAEWEFEPATKGGKPVAVRVDIPFHFPPAPQPSEDNKEPGKSNFEIAMAVLEREFGRVLFTPIEESIVTVGQLGRRPRPKGKVRVLYPEKLVGSGKTGEVRVSVVIDKEGRVVNPRILSASDPAFSYSGLRAAVELQFRPVKQKGEVVYVGMVIPFFFSEEKSYIVKLPVPPAGRGGRDAGGGWQPRVGDDLP